MGLNKKMYKIKLSADQYLTHSPRSITSSWQVRSYHRAGPGEKQCNPLKRALPCPSHRQRRQDETELSSSLPAPFPLTFSHSLSFFPCPECAHSFRFKLYHLGFHLLPLGISRSLLPQSFPVASKAGSPNLAKVSSTCLARALPSTWVSVGIWLAHPLWGFAVHMGFRSCLVNSTPSLGLCHLHRFQVVSDQ